MAAIMRTAKFVITGASITERARDLMLSGEWKSALEYLRVTLPEMSIEQCIEVLEGRQKLVGQNDNVDLVAEEDTSVAAKLDEGYRSVFNSNGFIKLDNRMYQVYAVVTSLGHEDMTRLRGFQLAWKHAPLYDKWSSELDSVNQKLCWAVYEHAAVQVRALFYADNPDVDKAFTVRTKNHQWVVALLEKVATGTAPFWREKECTSVQQAYEQVAQFLPERGNAQLYGTTLEAINLAEVAASVAERKERHAQEATGAAAQLSEEEQELAQEKAAAELQKAQEFQAYLADLRAKICAYADSDEEHGWMVFRWKSPAGKYSELRVPGRAMICYALSTTSATHLMPEYQHFSDEGLKLYRDNPYHTDAWVGAGFSVDQSAYDRSNDYYHAFQALVSKLQKEWLGFQATVLASGDVFYGKVVHADSAVIDETCILVVPHGGEEFHTQAMQAGAVVMQVGGKLAHLVTVCREDRKPVLRLDDAMTKFKVGQYLTLDTAKGTIEASAVPLTMSLL